MSHPGTRGALFDIDGTLINTGGAGAAAWRAAFEELHGQPRGDPRDRRVGDDRSRRQSRRAALRPRPRSLPREPAQAMARYMDHLAAAVQASEGYAVMPSVVELLRQLVDDGCLLGLVTGNLEAAARIKLARAHRNRFFSFGGYGSDSNDRAEMTRRALERGRFVSGNSLDVNACVAVGDTPRDVTAAHGAGIRWSPWRPATTASPSSRPRGPTSCSPRCTTGRLH